MTGRWEPTDEQWAVLEALLRPRRPEDNRGRSGKLEEVVKLLARHLHERNKRLSGFSVDSDRGEHHRNRDGEQQEWVLSGRIPEILVIENVLERSEN